MSESRQRQTVIDHFIAPQLQQQEQIAPIRQMVEEQQALITQLKDQVALFNHEPSKIILNNFISAIELTWKLQETTDKQYKEEQKNIKDKLNQIELTQIQHTKEIEDIYEYIANYEKENQDEADVDNADDIPAQQEEIQEESSREVIPLIARKLELDAQELQTQFDNFCEKYQARISLEVLEGEVNDEYLRCLATSQKIFIVVFDANAKRYWNYGQCSYSFPFIILLRLLSFV